MDDSDAFNDETFGAPPGLDAPPGLQAQESNLPSFFSNNSGVTILDELAGLSMTGDALESGGLVEDDEDYANMEGTFNTEDDGDDYMVDEKLPDFFSAESKMYDDDILGMKIGRESTESEPSSFSLPNGARIIDSSSSATTLKPPLQQQQQQQMQQQQQQQMQQQQFQHHTSSPYQYMPPPPQILLCPPGALPPPQSISALSTPGQMQTWHHRQNFQPQLHPQLRQQQMLQMQQQQRHQQMQQMQQQQMRGHYHQMNMQQFPRQMVAPGLANTGSVAQGLTLPTDITDTPHRSSESTPTGTPAPSARRGPPAVKGGTVPQAPPPIPTPAEVAIAVGLQQQQQQLQQQPPLRPRMVPQQQFRHVAHQQNGPRLPCGSCMSHSDVRFVVGKVLQTTETHDPFNDDFYFIQIPLPTWTETKKRIRAQIDESRQHYEDRSRKWEIHEKVLGHNVKSDVSKPRPVLSVPRMPPPPPPSTGGTGVDSEGNDNNNLDDMINGLDEDVDEGASSAITPFVTVLWNMRGAVHRGYGALYVAQELRQLLNTPLVNAPNNVAIRADIIQEANDAVALVCKSVGLKEPTNTISASTDFLSKIQTSSQTGVLLDGGLVAALLQTTKGKKLMRRSICLLQATQRWTLLPVLVARILQRDPEDQSKEDIQVEASLLVTIIDFIQYEEECIVNRVEVGNNIPPAVLLVHLRQCIKSVMVSQMETKQLRKALVSSRKRAEVMHIILRLGDQIVTTFCKEELAPEEGANVALHYIDPQRKTDWMQLRDAFMLMLEN